MSTANPTDGDRKDKLFQGIWRLNNDEAHSLLVRALRKYPDFASDVGEAITRADERIHWETHAPLALDYDKVFSEYVKTIEDLRTKTKEEQWDVESEPVE